MLVALDQRIEMLRASDHQDLQLLIGDHLLQIAIDGAKTDMGRLFAHPRVKLIGGRMRLIILNDEPNQFELFRISRATA